MGEPEVPPSGGDKWAHVGKKSTCWNGGDKWVKRIAVREDGASRQHMRPLLCERTPETPRNITPLFF